VKGQEWIGVGSDEGSFCHFIYVSTEVEDSIR